MFKRTLCVILAAVGISLLTACEVDEELGKAFQDVALTLAVISVNEFGYEGRFSDIQVTNKLVYIGNGVFVAENKETRLKKAVDINCRDITKQVFNDIVPFNKDYIKCTDRLDNTKIYDYNGKIIAENFKNIYAGTNENAVYIAYSDRLEKYRLNKSFENSNSGINKETTVLELLWTTHEINGIPLHNSNIINDKQCLIVGNMDDTVKIVNTTNGKILKVIGTEYIMTHKGSLFVKEKDKLIFYGKGCTSVISIDEAYSLIDDIGDNIVIGISKEYYIVDESLKIKPIGDIDSIHKNIILQNKDNLYYILNSRGLIIDSLNNADIVNTGDNFVVISDNINKIANIYCADSKLLSISFKCQPIIYKGTSVIIDNLLINLEAERFFTTKFKGEVNAYIFSKYIEVVDYGKKLEFKPYYDNRWYSLEKNISDRLLDIHNFKIVLDKQGVIEVIKVKTDQAS